MTGRRQATLFLSSPHKGQIESIRSHFNRAQFDLIRAHVTLCREDEVLNWDELELRLSRLGRIEVSLDFGMPVREGNLVFIPAVGSTQSFDALRNALISTADSTPRKHNPHITLIHPRNGICDETTFEKITRQCQPFSAVFHRVTFIEQVGGGPWRELTSFA